MRGSAAGRPSRAGSPSRLLPSKQLVLRIRTCSVAAARIRGKRAEGNHACEKVANLGARGDSVAGIDFEGRVLPYAHKAAGEVVSAGAEKQRCHPSSVSGSQLIDSSEARAGADDVDCGREWRQSPGQAECGSERADGIARGSINSAECT